MRVEKTGGSDIAAILKRCDLILRQLHNISSIIPEASGADDRRGGGREGGGLIRLLGVRC